MGVAAKNAIQEGFLRCVALNLQQNASSLSAGGHSFTRRSVGLGPKNNNSRGATEQDRLFYGNNNDNQQEYEDDDMGWNGMDSDNDDVQEGEEIDPNQVDESMLSDFKQYCLQASKFHPMPKSVVDSLRLMRTLRQTKASLDTYDAVMEWHLKANGDLHQHESVGRSKHFRSRKSLFRWLRKRYNMAKNYNNVTKIILPSTKACVNIVWTDAKIAIQSLLTDPRIRANDYIFGGEDPFTPPSQSNVIGDLHTAKAYLKTYQQLITRPNEQILLPILIYIDGAATGQFSDHQITAVKISLGIFTRKARDKPHFWRTIGYIPPNTRDKSRGLRLFIESGHLDATRAVHEAHENEGELDGQEVPFAQDLHTMLDKVLESFVKIQNSGFKWDLFYNQKLYKGVEFVPFVPFIKCDTDEADKLCGSYSSRGKNVSQLCRYCKCPTRKSDDHLANYPMKSKAQIQALVDRNDLYELKNLSQQCIQNACYKLRFGLHNNLSVHGATPLEMLHALLLGIFKYLRDTFFVQLGETGKLADHFDSLAKEYGTLLSRQSCREKPKTKFSNGIRKGKLMAKEYTGVLWCMLAVVCSTRGAQLVGKKKKYFGPTYLADWVMVIETLLQWEEWMKSDTMKRKHVQAARKKHRFIMYLVRKVASRQKGMGLKLTKFHAILHIADDILNFGVPMEVDTGSNESGHKPTKTAAKLTQKQRATFEAQTAKRLDEVHMLELAELEESGFPLWHYYLGHEFDLQEASNSLSEGSDSSVGSDNLGQNGSMDEANVFTGGAAFRVYRDENGEHQIQSVRKVGAKGARFMMEETLLSFFVGLQDRVSGHYKEVPLLTFHRRNGQYFRSSASYRGSVWRDWVFVDWGDWGILPNKVWGFVDLTDLPPNSGIDYGGIDNLPPAVYAIVETAKWTNDYDTELVRRIETEVTKVNGKVHDLVFYLADVEAFHEPAIVVPDIGGPENGYLVFRNRSEWRSSFESWLESPSNEDEMSTIQGSSEEENESEEEDSESVGSGNSSTSGDDNA